MAKKKAPKYGDVVLVKWLDSCTPNRCWQHVDDAKDYGCVECVSTGFWIKQDKKALVIAQSFGDHEAGNLMAIPPICIQSMKVLSRAKKR